MNIRILTAAVILCSLDASNSLTCYNCTGGDIGDSNCGDKLMDKDSISTIECSGQCFSTQETTYMEGQTQMAYVRQCGDTDSCQTTECQNITVGPNQPPETVCTKCCNNTNLCNGDYTESMPDSASASIVNIATVFTLLLLKVMT